MTPEILLTFLILGAALLLFFTGWVRMDVVALLVLVVLAFTGLVTPTEALDGFSNPAVITVWAMFILSAGLYQTGVARAISRQLLKIAGEGEVRLIVTIMLTAGMLSSIMNNMGVVALLLPVVMDLARARNISPSRLLMPMAFGSMMGGLVTLIGTPPNLLISYGLERGGEDPFRLFDFTPIGLSALVAGVLFVALAGRHFLPHRDAIKQARQSKLSSLVSSYSMGEHAFYIRILPDSHLVHQTLRQSRLRNGLGLNVLSILRERHTISAPSPETMLLAGDKLHVQGDLKAIAALKKWVIEPFGPGDLEKAFLEADLQVYEAEIPEKSPLLGKRLGETGFRKTMGVNVLGVRKEDDVQYTMLHGLILQRKHVLLLQGPVERLARMEKKGHILLKQPLTPDMLTGSHGMQEVLFVMQAETDAGLLEKAIAESQIGSAFGLTVLGKFSPGDKLKIHHPGAGISEGDKLLVKGNRQDIPLIQGLQQMEILQADGAEFQDVESGNVLMAEAVLAPRSLLAGKTLREINFRQKYGVTVVGFWRQGQVYTTQLGNMPLEFGESLLVHGSAEKLELLGQESDFILLTETTGSPQPKRTGKILTSVSIMAAMLLSVILGIVPLAIATIAGVAMMVITGCLKMEEAYRAIDWKAVFLIAGTLPLGAAMHNTGAASLLANGVVEIFGPFGPWGVVAALYLVTSISTLAIQPAALVVIMSPIALETAATFSLPPQTVMMAVAIAAAAAFMSPVSHAANLMVMGPGGYGFKDYLKVGVPLTLVVMAVAMLLLPVFWPL